MNSKRKGNGGERELLSILQAVGVAERNDQRYTGGVDNPDISFTLGGRRFHVECKRAERFNAYAAMEQAEHDANGMRCRGHAQAQPRAMAGGHEIERLGEIIWQAMTCPHH